MSPSSSIRPAPPVRPGRPALLHPASGWLRASRASPEDSGAEPSRAAVWQTVQCGARCVAYALLIGMRGTSPLPNPSPPVPPPSHESPVPYNEPSTRTEAIAQTLAPARHTWMPCNSNSNSNHGPLHTEKWGSSSEPSTFLLDFCT